ncbi:PepSY-associated TM helix domain-containing protein [Geothrix sp.]|jgi:hypothetical protein|uniref:PepSY-associated TM helix domain-containing protein n=1 Tax=Geothrix sp. TaxID=1962974 RepID=UPI0025C5687C|nr:PepSY-associated TM helix domain-containing protein [Geothrix sp.]
MTRPRRFLVWLRKVHAWVGLAGAALGLLFGTTGFLLNHRAVLKVPGGRIETERIQLELTEAPASPESLARDLALRFGFAPERARWQVQPAKPVRFSGAPVTTAGTWTILLGTHRRQARATYLPGNRTVDVEARRADLVGTLQRMHKSDAGHAPWILLADAFAGALVFLTVSGTLLWTRLAGERMLAITLAAGGFLTLMLVAALAW